MIPDYYIPKCRKSNGVCMKEKVIECYNGRFVYDQPGLKTEPEELVLELKPGETAEGSFVVSSMDERRVKGLLHTRIPGMTLRGDSFFARAARVEYSYRPRCLREGEELEGAIWLETSAGEYALPVKVRVQGAAAEEEADEELPVILAGEAELPVQKAGPGRSEEHRKERELLSLGAEFQRVLEEERGGNLSGQEADGRFRKLVDRMAELQPESALGPLADAWVMLREDRREEAGWLLKKYEKTRLLQQKEASVRAAFLYVNSLFCREEKVTAHAVTQLQKIWQKHPDDRMATAFLLELDPGLKDNARARYRMLERQFHAGVRNRLLYQEAYVLLREDPALFTGLDHFSLQVFGWAASRGHLTVQTAQAAASQASRIKRWSPMAARFLKACYEVHPSKETAGAVCSVYIRGHRTDAEAFGWYEKGVEWDAKITNLYEYFIYALPEDYPGLLPRQVLLYFHYHNTLTSRQKTTLYCNLVRYGSEDDPVCEEHGRLLQEFLLEQLRERRLNESLAWLYGKCLLAEALEDELLDALADLLFLQKITCREKRIRQVEVRHRQLEEAVRVPFTGGTACVPVYTEDARITLIDEEGRRHEKTVSYERKRLMIEPKFLQLCRIKRKDHLGLNLMTLDGKGLHQLREDNLSAAWKLLEDVRVKESYRQQLKVELLDYERRHRRLEQIHERLLFSDGEVQRLSRACQGSYIEILILLGQDQAALRLLWKTGCREVEERLLLRLLQRLLEDERPSVNLLMPLAWQVFEKGLYTEQVVELLTESCVGNTRELLALWKAGEQFGMSLPELEEQLVVQALFTGQYVCEVFPVFQSLDDRGGESVLGTAYLNYVSWLDFVKGQQVPEGLFDSLEHHLLWEDRLHETAVLAYLKQLSVLLLLTDTQKRLAGRLLKELTAKSRRFAFMQNLRPYMEEKGRPADQVVVEYRCSPRHRVILHYVLEYHGRKNFDYMTEQLYPVCGGIFVRSFVLFYGERLTWFFTETAEDGSEISTECKTAENREEQTEGDSRYSRLCRMQRALDYGQERLLKRMMAEYEELTELTEERFHVR